MDSERSRSFSAMYVDSAAGTNQFTIMEQSSIAARICLYLTVHHLATRPQLRRELKVNEKSLESAMRKLVRLNIVIDTGRKRRENGRRFACIFALGPVEFDQTVYSVGPTPRGRPTKSNKHASAITQQLSEELVNAMRSFRGANCSTNTG